MSEIERSDRAALMNRMVEDYILKGENNATRIAKSMGIPRKDVVIFQEEWKSIVSNDEGLQERARESVGELDHQYDQIIKELWNAHAESNTGRDQAGVLKTIADVIAKRQEILERAGLVAGADLGDQLAQSEEQAAQITSLLKAVVNAYPETKMMILDGLSRIFQKAASVDGDDNPVA